MDQKYWEKRYLKGQTSGKGSIGVSRAWKWSLLEDTLPRIANVVDVGCGDLSFWENRSCKNYTGIDFSSTIIEKNRIKKPHWRFINAPAEHRIADLKASVVFCFDLLFHVMDTQVFQQILQNLCYYAEHYIALSTWKNSPFDVRVKVRSLLQFLFRFDVKRSLKTLTSMLQEGNKTNDGKYRFYRPLEKYFPIFWENDFRLKRIETSPDRVTAIYLFEKK